jgi:hypothetical protein
MTVPSLAIGKYQIDFLLVGPWLAVGIDGIAVSANKNRMLGDFATAAEARQAALISNADVAAALTFAAPHDDPLDPIVPGAHRVSTWSA